MDNDKKSVSNSPKQAVISTEETVRAENPAPRSADVHDTLPIRDRLNEVQIPAEGAVNIEHAATGSDEVSDDELKLIRFNRIKDSFLPGATGALAYHHDVDLSTKEIPDLEALETCWLNSSRVPPKPEASVQQSENVNLIADSLNTTEISNTVNVDSNRGRDETPLADEDIDWSKHPCGAFASYDVVRTPQDYGIPDLGRYGQDFRKLFRTNFKPRTKQNPVTESGKTGSIKEDDKENLNTTNDEDVDLKSNPAEDREKSPKA